METLTSCRDGQSGAVVMVTGCDIKPELQVAMAAFVLLQRLFLCHAEGEFLFFLLEVTNAFSCGLFPAERYPHLFVVSPPTPPPPQSHVDAGCFSPTLLLSTKARSSLCLEIIPITMVPVA